MSTKIKTGILIWLLVLVSAGILYRYTPLSFVSLENRIRDLMFSNTSTTKTTGKVVIVDIDERSLLSLGQWPWERNIVAKLLENLANSGVKIIGLDILFAEKDKTSPRYINEKMRLDIKNPPDYDNILADTLSHTPTVTGYTFDMESNGSSSSNIPHLPIIIIEKNPIQNAIYQAKGIHANIETIQSKSRSSGFFNVLPDASGIVRSAPLLIRYQDNLYPLLSFEMVRLVMGQQKIIVNYHEQGVESIKLGDKLIPVDSNGKMAINFRGAGRTFEYISAVDVLENRVPKSKLEGKLVLIGSSSAGLLDLRATPLDNAMAGVEIHANIIENILTNDFLLNPKWVEGLNIFLFAALFTALFFLFLNLNTLWVFLTTISFLPTIYYLISYTLTHQKLMINTALPFIALFLALVTAVIINNFFESKQRRTIHNLFAKKVSASVVDELLKNPDQDSMRNREENITILFSDIRNFTSISEKINSAPKLIKLLNAYISPMTDIILENRGTIDKYMGDGIMAYWNAPQPIDDHPDIAVKTALLQMEKLGHLKKPLKDEFGVEIDIGIGINTGKAVVGEIGSAGRSDYTVIGDAINIASRIEALNKIYGTSVIISESTRSMLKKRYVLRELDTVEIRGKKTKIRIFEVIRAGEVPSDMQDELGQYQAALEAYKKGRLEEANDIFTSLNSKYPSKLYDIYMTRTS